MYTRDVVGVIRVRAEILARLLDEARGAPHEECCGLLAGTAGVVTHIFPATNVLASATAYEIAPGELFRLFREMRSAGLQHLGIYHSHPTGDNWPSRRDIEGAFYSDAACFIVSPLPSALHPVRAFSLRNGAVSELALEKI